MFVRLMGRLASLQRCLKGDEMKLANEISSSQRYFVGLCDGWFDQNAQNAVWFWRGFSNGGWLYHLINFKHVKIT